jgi:DNA-binding MarR family transcriptional regulator
MKPLDDRSNFSPDECAARLIDAVPLVMRTIRTEMRKHRPHDLSLPGFRVLMFLRRKSGASLSDVAEHIGLTLPTMSKLVDGLVRKGLVVRENSTEDRRRVTLELSAHGREVLGAAQSKVRPGIARAIEGIPVEEIEILNRAAEIIRKAFAPNENAE